VSIMGQTAHKPKLLDRVRGTIRRKHYSIRTEESYVDWVRRYILFHGKRHPNEMGERQIEQFLTYLAVERNVAASTQNQAMNALVFLYRQVLGIELDKGINAMRAKRPKRLPTVLTRPEAEDLLAALQGMHLLIVQLLYGAGLRVMECVRLRVKDVDFARMQIMVRDGKGMKDRVTMLPVCAAGPLKDQLEMAAKLHKQDLAAGCGEV